MAESPLFSRRDFLKFTGMSANPAARPTSAGTRDPIPKILETLGSTSAYEVSAQIESAPEQIRVTETVSFDLCQAM
jgi:hypothetical protein